MVCRGGPPQHARGMAILQQFGIYAGRVGHYYSSQVTLALCLENDKLSNTLNIKALNIR